MGVVAEALHGDIAHGGVEIADIEAALRLGGQRVVFQCDDNAVALLLDVGITAETGCVKLHDAGIAAAFAEVDVGGGNGLCCAGRRRGNGVSGNHVAVDVAAVVDGGRVTLSFACGFTDVYPYFIAFDFGVVLACFIQTQQDTRTVVILSGSNLAEQRVGIFQYRLSQLNVGVGKIQSDSRRRGGGETAGRGHLFIKSDFDDFLVVRQSRYVDIGDVAGKGCLHGQA